MGMTVVLIAVLGLWAAGAAGQGDDCTPFCPPDCTVGDKVPNPVSCGQYYLCLEDCLLSDPAFDCPDGTVFSVADGDCVEDDGSGSNTCGACEPPCKFTCTANYTGLIADRDNCHLAYLCYMDPPLETNCGESLYFDGTTCQANETLCCDPCQVYCETPFTEIMDPTDCTAYYFCLNEGWPLPADRYQCDEGEMFVDGRCQATQDPADCYQPCAGTTNIKLPAISELAAN